MRSDEKLATSQEVSAISEDSLLREAGSFGDALELLCGSGAVPAELIAGQHWEALTRRAGALHATVAAFPFGFEMPLHDCRPRADLGVTILGGSRTAAAIKEEERFDGPSPCIVGLARLLREMDRKDSALRRITGREFMLRFDIDVERHDARLDPAVFLGSVGRPICGDGHSMRYADIGVLLDSIALALRREPDEAGRRQVERVYSALTPETRIDNLGVCPTRDGVIRVELNGFRTASDVLAFLKRVGWHKGHSPIATALCDLEARRTFDHLGIHLDTRADGLETQIGINLMAMDERPQDGRYWLDKASNWTALIAALGEHGLVVPEKLSALSRWPGARIVPVRFDAFVLLRGISHFELVTSGSQIEQVNAYAYMFLRSVPRDISTLARLAG